MRIKTKVNMLITDDTAGKDVLFGPDDQAAQVQIDAYARETSGKMLVNATETEVVPFGDVEFVKGAYLIFSDSCSVSINESLDTLPIEKAPDADVAKFFIEAAIDQINITAGSSNLTVTYCIWGDLAS